MYRTHEMPETTLLLLLRKEKCTKSGKKRAKVSIFAGSNVGAEDKHDKRRDCADLPEGA